MFVAFVAKSIVKPKNGVLTRFVTATKLRQPMKVATTKKRGLSQNFFERTLLRALERVGKLKIMM